MARITPASATTDGGPLAHGADVSEAFERECVEFFADVVGVLGVPRSIGQIYGLLFASPQPLSFTDIVEKLDISRGSASQGLHSLRALGAVKIVSTEEDRRGLFVPELGLRRLVSGVLREKVDPLVTDGGARLKKLREHANATPTAAGKRFSLDRVKQIESWRGQLGLLLPLLKTILGKRA